MSGFNLIHFRHGDCWRQSYRFNGRKENAVLAYSTFLRMLGRTWEAPKYKREETLPWIPLESEIDQLIAGCSPKVATFLQLLKETGMSPGEAWRLKWIDVDFEKNAVYVRPEKGVNQGYLRCLENS